jgi:hypothetical protein
MKDTTLRSLACTAILTTTSIAFAQKEQPAWLEKTISPVANPIYFEDPRITTEVRPIFIQHWLPDTFHYEGGSVPLGGAVQVYALQARWAITDKLGLIATKDGYIDMNPDNTLQHEHGWANIAAGLKYGLVQDNENQFLVTPGFTIELPTGNEDVLQGRGKGIWNFFASAEKGWNNLHLTGNLGFDVPNDFSENTSQMHYSVQLDYYVCQHFIPFIVGNGYTVLSEGENLLLGSVPLNTEMSDLINFGSTDARGWSQFIIGAGFRSKLVKNLDFGFAYEYCLTSPDGIFDQRITVDLIWRLK